jgi:hypothetical protein
MSTSTPNVDAVLLRLSNTSAPERATLLGMILCRPMGHDYAYERDARYHMDTQLYELHKRCSRCTQLVIERWNPHGDIMQEDVISPAGACVTFVYEQGKDAWLNQHGPMQVQFTLGGDS